MTNTTTQEAVISLVLFFLGTAFIALSIWLISRMLLETKTLPLSHTLVLVLATLALVSLIGAIVLNESPLGSELIALASVAVGAVAAGLSSWVTSKNYGDKLDNGPDESK